MKRYIIALILAAVCGVGSSAQETDSLSVAQETVANVAATTVSVSEADKMARW